MTYHAIADYYDAEYQSRDMLAHDVPFFLGQLPKRRQSVLELAVGTARAAIPIAQAGHRVVGTDFDPAMIAIAKRKRDFVGIPERNLKLLRQDAMRTNLPEKFDWICIFFNTLLTFSTLEQQDRMLAGVRKHLKPRGRFWIDIFNPDLALLSRPRNTRLDPVLFHVPHLNRDVMRTADIHPDPVNQRQHVVFEYRWFDAGRERRQRREFDLTFLFPRELQLLVERNGMQIETLWGNYDGSKLTNQSPRIIARCKLAP